jgi:hypothetical protein
MQHNTQKLQGFWTLSIVLNYKYQQTTFLKLDMFQSSGGEGVISTLLVPLEG